MTIDWAHDKTTFFLHDEMDNIKFLHFLCRDCP